MIIIYISFITPHRLPYMVICYHCKILCTMEHMCKDCQPDIYSQLIAINAFPLANYIMWQTFVHHCISHKLQRHWNLHTVSFGKIGFAEWALIHSLLTRSLLASSSPARWWLARSLATRWLLARSPVTRWLLAGYSFTLLLTGYSFARQWLTGYSFAR